MKKSDEITVVKADIRRLKVRRRYTAKIHRSASLKWRVFFSFGLADAIATHEKYLAKIEKGTK